MEQQQIKRLRKQSKSRNLLNKDQLDMLKKEYHIKLNVNNNEAQALKLLRGGKFLYSHAVIAVGAVDEGVLVREIRKGKVIFQR